MPINDAPCLVVLANMCFGYSRCRAWIFVIFDHILIRIYKFLSIVLCVSLCMCSSNTVNFVNFTI